jgi:predicted unusual protein kinase regulating ubiquinone biosynthesis (AarF/ABC1/UbiB family)
MKDKGFIAEMTKLQETIYPVTGEEAEKVIEEMKAVKPEILVRARKIYE